MRKKPWTILLPALVVWSTIACAESAEDELRQLLDEFLAGASANDAAVHDRFWAEDLVYTSSSGERFGKVQIMQGLSADQETIAEDVPAYSARDTQIQVFGDTAVITFRLIATRSNEETEQYFNTGVFRLRKGQWKATTWQATQATGRDQ